jgi:hypothetical protein
VRGAGVFIPVTPQSVCTGGIQRNKKNVRFVNALPG